MKKILIIFIAILSQSVALADQPKKWQMGFQEPASQSMRDIVWFHDYMLVPIIVAISAFVLFLMLYAMVRLGLQETLIHLKELTMFWLKLYGH